MPTGSDCSSSTQIKRELESQRGRAGGKQEAQEELEEGQETQIEEMQKVEFESSESDAWVEKEAVKSTSPSAETKQRDDWMSADNFFLPMMESMTSSRW